MVLPYSVNALEYLAQRIIDEHKHSLPDLSQVVILLSNAQAATGLRRHLLQIAGAQGHQALIGLQVSTLQQWISQTLLLNQRIIHDQSRELMLVEALKDHPELYGLGSPWTLAKNLLDLFDDITRSHIRIPGDLTQFQQQLATAYGIMADSTALNREATLVHSLWYAMQQQLSSLNLIDRTSAYILKLKLSLDSLCMPGNKTQIYMLGQEQLSQAESEWLQTLQQRRKLFYSVQASDVKAATNGPLNQHLQLLSERLQQIFNQQTSDSFSRSTLPESDKASLQTYSQCLQSIFDHQNTTLLQRAQHCAKQYADNPLKRRIRIYNASSAEAEAQAVDFQVRTWLSQGARRIGIVTENRKLARRVRALLERANIRVNDSAGWVLSTTSAATVIERWLQSLEENFHYQPLLDLLKSPFAQPLDDPLGYMETVYRFEKGIVLEENVASDINRYIKHTLYRIKKLTPQLAAYYESIPALLSKIAAAAKPLQQLKGKHTPQQFVDALLLSLNNLHIYDRLKHDAAGEQILAVLEQAKIAASHSDIKMEWTELRAWLGQLLENAYFIPGSNQGPVYLMSLAQSDLQHFDALVIAGAEKEFLPGIPATSPFFNNTVRLNLGLGLSLTASQQHINHQFHWFFRLLHSVRQTKNQSPRILISKRISENDEEIIGSPWVEAITSFHHIAYKETLSDPILDQIIREDNFQIHDNSLELPQTDTACETKVPSSLIPANMTASAYQELMDCPYQYFAGRCLKLTPPESIKEMLQKSDYGERVHKCLQAFHGDVIGLPGPFLQEITETTLPQAIHVLQDISTQVFATDIENNFLHRAWLRQWQAMIEPYLRWQMQQQIDWKPHKVEQSVSRQYHDLYNINARLDRVDIKADKLRILDYKTGPAPKKSDVLSGETIQLPFYALLGEAVTASAQVDKVDYLSFASNKLTHSSYLDGEELNQLKQQVAQRLSDIMQAMHDGANLPAWGDDQSCRYCVMEGLCRKQSWDNRITQGGE